MPIHFNRIAADDPAPPEAEPEVEAEDTEEEDEEVDLTTEQVAEKLGEDYSWGDKLCLAVAEFCEAEYYDPFGDIAEGRDFSGFSVSGEYVSIEVGSKEYLVCDTYDTAEELAVAVVTQDLEQEPELFNQTWLSNHIDVDRLRDDLMSDVLNVRMEDLHNQADNDLEGLAEELGLDLEDYRSEPEVDEDGDETEGEIDEEALRSAVDDAIETYAEKLAEDELADPVAYLEELGSEDMLKNYLDVDAAAQDAVDTDGAAHFLSGYDGNQNDLSSGGCYFRTH